MTTVTTGKARAGLDRLLDQTAESHAPVLILGKRNNAVLVSEADWRAVQETLYLLFIPGMRDSILEGLKTPVSRCAKKIRR